MIFDIIIDCALPKKSTVNFFYLQQSTINNQHRYLLLQYPISKKFELKCL